MEPSLVKKVLEAALLAAHEPMTPLALRKLFEEEVPTDTVRKLLDGDQGDAFNLGTGNGVTVKELITAIETVTGKKVPGMISVRSTPMPMATVSVSVKGTPKTMLAPVV